MTDKVQKIREEVEKLKSNLMYGACSSQVAMETRCKEEAYNEVLAILDSKQEEPVSEDLEEAVNAYIGYAPDIDESPSTYGKRQAFKAGAQWQKEQDKETIELAEDHAMLAGMEKMKEQMMAKAIDAELYSDGMLTSIIKVNDKEKISDIKFGDKVKIIIIKEDKI